MESTLGHLRHVKWNGAGSGANHRLGGHVNTSQAGNMVTGIEYFVGVPPRCRLREILMLNETVRDT